MKKPTYFCTPVSPSVSYNKDKHKTEVALHIKHRKLIHHIKGIKNGVSLNSKQNKVDIMTL